MAIADAEGVVLASPFLFFNATAPVPVLWNYECCFFCLPLAMRGVEGGR